MCECLRWGRADFSRFSFGTGLPAARSTSLGSGHGDLPRVGWGQAWERCGR